MKRSFGLYLIMGTVLICFSTDAGLYSEEKKKDAGRLSAGKAEQTKKPAEDTSDSDEDEGLWSFKLRTRYKNLYSYQRSDNYMQYSPWTVKSKGLSADMNRVRLTPELAYDDNFVMHVDYDNEFVFGNYNKSYEFDSLWRGRGLQYNDITRSSWDISYNRNLYYRTKVHKAYVKVSGGDFTMTLGRQQIRFGSGRLWNPLDILNPITPTLLEGAEEQKGADAAKVDYYFSDTAGISLIYNPKRRNDSINDLSLRSSNSIGRFKITINETDIAFLGGYICQRWVSGLDISSVFLDGMLRGSAIYFRPEYDRPYFQASAGYEYTIGIGSGLYFLVEYFYNQNAINNNRDLKLRYNMSLMTGIKQYNYNWLSNQFLTNNQHYAGMVLGYDFMPLLRGDFFTIYDVQGRGIFLSPSLRFNVLDNLDISTGVMLAFVFHNKSSDFRQFAHNYLYMASLSFYF